MPQPKGSGGMFGYRPNALLRDVFLAQPPEREAQWRDRLGSQGSVQRSQLTLGDLLSGALRQSGVPDKRADRIGNRAAAALNDLTPIGNAAMAAQAGTDFRRGQTLSGIGLGALAILPGVLGNAGKRVGRHLGEPSQLNIPRTPSADEMARLSAVRPVPLAQARHGNRLEWERFNQGEYGQPLLPGYSDRPVAVQLQNGEYVLLDGNHRAALANASGAPSMDMHVIPARQYDPANAGRVPSPNPDLDQILAQLLRP